MSDNTYFESTDMRKNFKAYKKAYFKLWEEIERLTQENKQLQEALLQCRPLNIDGEIGYCIFCGGEIDEGDFGHRDDCEYLRLTD